MLTIVSIHASVKDATDNISATDMLTIVSIHASVKDATLWSLFFKVLPMRFNPRICKRCDLSYGKKISGCFVSIHASVKDATHAYAVPYSD